MKSSLTRRNVLRGLGATLALPWMESLSAAGPVKASAGLAKPPVRSAFLFMPNGVVPNHWTPEGDAETGFEITPMLKPVGHLRDEFTLVENLWHQETDGRNGHWPKVPAWLAGGFVERGSGGDIDTGGTSIDQIMAREIGHQTLLPSIELGVDQPRTGIDNVGGGFPRVVGSFISWRDPHTPVPKEVIPQLAFDRLFRTSNRFPTVPGLSPHSPEVQQSLQRDDVSVLDLVLDDAKSIQRRISGQDKAKLEEYLESVRDVERRIQKGMEPQKRWINEGKLDMVRPGPGIPESHEEHLRLMLDIIVLSFWTDSTRIATFMMGDAQTGRVFDFINGVSRKSFHGLSHHRNDAKVRDEYEKIGTWHVQQLAYLLEKMKSLDEGPGSLLDNSMILFGSSLKDGNRHDPHDLPLILAGRGGGTLSPGRRVRASKDTPMCNLLMAMSERMGVKPNQFGDSTGSLGGLG